MAPSFSCVLGFLACLRGFGFAAGGGCLLPEMFEAFAFCATCICAVDNHDHCATPKLEGDFCAVYKGADAAVFKVRIDPPAFIHGA